MDLEEEEVDLEFEQLHELELELGDVPLDIDEDCLSGKWVPFAETYTGRSTNRYSEQKMRKYLSDKTSLYEVPPNFRGEVYRYFQRQLKKNLAEAYRICLKPYAKAVRNIKIARV